MRGERTFVIGDIHGCLHLLEALLARIPWNPQEDRLVFLGDYIDRGPDSKGVIDLILKLRRASPGVRCLLGNHEDLFREYLSRKNLIPFILNGGDATLTSYRRAFPTEGEIHVPEDHRAFFHSLEPWIELEDYYLVHAGLRPGIPIEKQKIEDLLWIREPFLYSDYDFGKRVIFGHTPLQEPLVTKTKIGLDTGAVYGNRLTCLELPAFVFHSVDA